MILIAAFLPTLALAQSAAKPPQANLKASSAAASQNGKSHKDAAAKGSGSHTGSMIGNHKDVMETTVPPPSAGSKTQSATSSTASPAAQPAPGRPKK